MNVRNLIRAIAVATAAGILSTLMFGGIVGMDQIPGSEAEVVCHAPKGGSCMRLKLNSGAGVLRPLRQVRATLVDSNNAPLSSRIVRITLEESPDSPQTFHHVTDLWGQVVFTYFSNDVPGTDYLSVCEIRDFGEPCTEASATAEVVRLQACPEATPSSTPASTATPGSSPTPTVTPCPATPAALPPTGGRP